MMVIFFFIFWRFPIGQALRQRLEGTQTEVTSRQSQWRAQSQQVHEQMAVLKEENEDLRFQVSHHHPPRPGCVCVCVCR